MEARRLPWFVVLALAACAPAGDDTDETDDTDATDDTEVVETDETDETDDTDEAPTELGVLRGCAPTVGHICPYAGSSRNGFNGDGRDRLDTTFSFPFSITFSPYGQPVIADWNNHKLRVVEDDGTIRTIMGTAFLGDGDPLQADLTEAGALGTDVALNHPTRQVYYPDGRLLSASWHTHKLRTWDPDTGRVHVLLGNLPGFDEPAAAEPGQRYDADACKLNQPIQAIFDAAGDILMVDMRNERIRKLWVDTWETQTIAGNGTKGVCDDGDALTTCFNFPKSANPEPGGAIALSDDGTKLYIADTESHVIKVLDFETSRVTVLAGTPGEAGDVDAAGRFARFHFPTDLVLDGTTLFVADANNHKVRAIDLTTGAVTTFAGTGEATCPLPGGLTVPTLCDAQYLAGDGGPATEATLYRPFGVTLDLDGNLVVADTYNHRFRVIYR